MRRREFLGVLGGAAGAWPVGVWAQPQTRHIGVLVSGAESDAEMQARVAAVRQGLARFGWTEGRNIQIDYRYASATPEGAQVSARELVAQRPEVILGFGTLSSYALERETNTIPILFIGVPESLTNGPAWTMQRNSTLRQL